MCWTWFKTIGRSLKNLGPSQKTIRPTWCPKLVTGLVCRKILFLVVFVQIEKTYLSLPFVLLEGAEQFFCTRFKRIF